MTFLHSVKALLVAAVLAVAASLISVTPAYATLTSPHVEVYAQACPGGYVNDLRWNTQNESGTTMILGSNRIAIELWQVPAWSGSYLWINVQCNNGQWYAHGQYVYRPPTDDRVDLGWI